MGETKKEIVNDIINLIVEKANSREEILPFFSVNRRVSIKMPRGLKKRLKSGVSLDGDLCTY